MYLSIYFSLSNSYNGKKYFKLHKIHKDLFATEWWWFYLSPVNNIISDREEMFAGGNWSTCLGLDHFMTKQTDTISGARQLHDKTDRCNVWGLTISLQNTLILSFCISETWPFRSKTDWYYVWGSTISWQSTLILCLGLDQWVIHLSQWLNQKIYQYQ